MAKEWQRHQLMEMRLRQIGIDLLLGSHSVSILYDSVSITGSARIKAPMYACVDLYKLSHRAYTGLSRRCSEGEAEEEGRPRLRSFYLPAAEANGLRWPSRISFCWWWGW